jgi:hypothetical protein
VSENLQQSGLFNRQWPIFVGKNYHHSGTLHKAHPGKIEVVAAMTSATWNITGTHYILTVTGLNRIRLIAECTASLGSGGAAVVRLGTLSVPELLIPNTDFALIDTDELWYDELTGGITRIAAKDLAVFDFVSNGEDIAYDIDVAALNAGALKFHMWCEPLEDGASCVAGEG